MSRTRSTKGSSWTPAVSRARRRDLANRRRRQLPRRL